jgi:1,4-alpha-glucan branching enzyme
MAAPMELPDMEPCPTGIRFRIWAPHASAVSLIGPGDDGGEVVHPMLSGPRGHWTLELAQARAGDPWHCRIVTRWGATHPTEAILQR